MATPDNPTPTPSVSTLSTSTENDNTPLFMEDNKDDKNEKKNPNQIQKQLESGVDEVTESDPVAANATSEEKKETNEEVSPLMQNPPDELATAANNPKDEEAASTVSLTNSQNRKNKKIEEDYCLPASSHNSEEAEATSSSDHYEPFPQTLSRSSIQEVDQRSCCSHFLIVISGLFVLVHFGCCIVSWFIPWWDSVARLQVLKETEDGNHVWKDIDVPVLRDSTFGVMLQNVQAVSPYVGVFVVILSAIVLPSICIIAHFILVYVVYKLTDHSNNTMDKPASTTEEVTEEKEKEIREEMERNALLMEEERLLEAPFANAPSESNNLTEPLLPPSTSVPDNSIEIEELPSAVSNNSNGSNGARCSFIRKCISRCSCSTGCIKRIITTESTLGFFETMYKYALCLVYVQTYTFIATSGAIFNLGGNDDDDNIEVKQQYQQDQQEHLLIRATVVNETRGGYISYFLGINVGIVATVLLRAHLNYERQDRNEEEKEEVEVLGGWTSFSMGRGESEMPHLENSQNDSNDEENDDMSGVGDSINSGIKTPPISAFRFSQGRSGDNGSSRRNQRQRRSQGKGRKKTRNRPSSSRQLEDDLGGSILPERMDLSSTRAQTEENTSDSSFLNPSSFSATPLNNNNNTLKSTLCSLNFWQKVLVFESGLVSVLFLVPTYSLPIIRLNYNGLAAALLPTTTRDLTIWNFLFLVWSNPTNSNYFVRAVTTSVFWINIIMLPIVALLCALVLRLDQSGNLTRCWRCLSFWRRDINYTRINRKSLTSNEASWYKALQYVSPSATALPFSVGVLVSAFAMIDVSKQIFDQDAICRSANLDRDCLLIEGEALTGTWLCFVQAIALECFICLTLIHFKEKHDDSIS